MHVDPKFGLTKPRFDSILPLPSQSVNPDAVSRAEKVSFKVSESPNVLNLGDEKLTSDASPPPKRPRHSFRLTDFKGSLVEKVQVANPVHPHSAEQQELFVDITEAATCDDSRERDRALKILATDASLQPLLLRFGYFIFESTRSNLIQGFPLLLGWLMNMVGAMLENPSLDIESVLFKLLPAVISVLIAKPMTYSNRHFKQKRYCAELIKKIVRAESSTKQRVIDVLTSGLHHRDCSIYATYGIAFTLNRLGNDVREDYLFPNLRQIKTNLNSASVEELQDARVVFKTVACMIENYIRRHSSAEVLKFREQFEYFVQIQ